MSTIDEARQAWLANRKMALGASEVPTLFGVGFESPYSLWARKLGLLPPVDETERMEVGTLIQPVIMELLRRRTDLEIVEAPQDEFIRSPDTPFIGCTPDGRAFDDARPTPGVVEIKNVGQYLGKEWGDEPPLRVQVQIQCQMYALGYDWGIAAGLIGGNQLAWHRIERNEKFIAALVKVSREFWNCIETQTAPEIDGSEHTRRAIMALHPNDNGETVVLSHEFIEYAARLEALDAEAKRIETESERIRNMLREAIGSNTFGTLPDGSGWSFKTSPRKGYTVAESTVRTLRRFKAKGN